MKKQEMLERLIENAIDFLNRSNESKLVGVFR
jgi:hypothetical protein